jgi:hypothetical protein
MFRYQCPTCSTVTFFREATGARQTWCPACQDEVRVQPRAADAKPEEQRAGARGTWMTALLALPLLGIVAWALISMMPERAESPPGTDVESNTVDAEQTSFPRPQPRFPIHPGPTRNAHDSGG